MRRHLKNPLKLHFFFLTPFYIRKKSENGAGTKKNLEKRVEKRPTPSHNASRISVCDLPLLSLSSHIRKIALPLLNFRDRKCIAMTLCNVFLFDVNGKYTKYSKWHYEMK